MTTAKRIHFVIALCARQEEGLRGDYGYIYALLNELGEHSCSIPDKNRTLAIFTWYS